MMLELLGRLFPLRLAPNSPDTDRAVEILKEYLPFEVHEYSPGEEHNGWIVPHRWEVKKALIKKDGQVIFDGKKHPIGVMGYAKPFQGTVTLDELKAHLSYREDWPEAIGYHCDYFYKPWCADWGFSVPYTLYCDLKEGDYEVDLQISQGAGTMKVCDFFLSGEKEDTIILNAHNCHAAQANDDIAGIVVGIALMKRLLSQPRRFSYRLIIAPEHLGTVFYLAHAPRELIRTFKYGIFLEMLGIRKRLALQETFNGDSCLDRAGHHYLKFHATDCTFGKFRKIVGNDETVWESPGFEVPTVSLSRFPYREYHTNFDNMDIIDEGALENSLSVVLGILEIMETNCTVQRKFDGLVALSNPKYDLYISPGNDPIMGLEETPERQKWNYMMDCLPRYLDGKMSILDIAERHDIEYRQVYEYLVKFQEKGLVEFVGHAPRQIKGTAQTHEIFS